MKVGPEGSSASLHTPIMAVLSLLTVILSLLAVISTVSSLNITQILSETPEYSSFNNYLTQTKLADEINSRTTITLLVLNNGAMSSLAGKNPLSVIKNVLSLLVLLDYYDPQKLHQLSKGTTLSTTLYQTTGNTPGNLGFVNITDLKGGKVGFGSAAPGSKLASSYTKSVKQIPYNISILEIDAPIIAPGVLTPSETVSNITGLLEKAGCKTFANLLVSSGVLKTFESTVKTGLTVFAPDDEAFKKEGVPDLTKLSQAELVSLLEFHALSQYKPKGSLKTDKEKISTLATSGAGKFDLTTTTSGDEVILHTGVAPSRVADTVIDSTPVVIFTVDNVLLPAELFGNATSPSPAPAPEPVTAPTMSPTEGPSPMAASPPAPPTDDSPGSAPSDSPARSADSKAPNAAVGLRSPSLFTGFVTLAAVAVTVSLCF